MSSEGKLLYVMGASGAGKDTVLQTLAVNLPANAPVYFAQRVITRAAGDLNEAHTAVAEPDFLDMVAQGQFALHWQAHGLHYGITKNIVGRLKAGHHVIVNGSRAYFSEALAQFPNCLQPVLIDVPETVLRQRLLDRGRESAENIEQRLRRHREMRLLLPDDVIVIDNSGSVEASSRMLRDLLAV